MEESAPPTYANRRCCDTPMNQPHTDTCARRGGRPTTTGPTPTRQAGRHGQIWEDCEQQARADGQTMTAFVAAALRRELDHRRASATSNATVCTDPWQTPHTIGSRPNMCTLCAATTRTPDADPANGT